MGYKTPVTIAKWEKGDNKPSFSSLATIADMFNVSVEDLMHVDIEERERDMLQNITNISEPAAYAVPILGTICAGHGIGAREEYDGVFFVDNSIRADLCLNVKGDSMLDAGINDGDIAFLKKNCDFINGKIYAVVIGDDDIAVLRKVYWTDRQLILKPCNENYQPIITTEIETRVVGVCIGVYHGV